MSPALVLRRRGRDLVWNQHVSPEALHCSPRMFVRRPKRAPSRNASLREGSPAMCRSEFTLDVSPPKALEAIWPKSLATACKSQTSPEILRAKEALLDERLLEITRLHALRTVREYSCSTYSGQTLMNEPAFRAVSFTSRSSLLPPDRRYAADPL